jgi:hypothetical protein
MVDFKNEKTGKSSSLYTYEVKKGRGGSMTIYFLG